ncbi:MAG: hypothetical protein BMS9Abin15_0535 [Gammaproteobacteria bacterium]|nr:MAG: hypothetical protein BMS9Abin15_0535 [Gammaproteobacteria bacterium]
MKNKTLPFDIEVGFTDVGGACTEAEPFALRVIGDSMEPEFNDGHIIVIDPAGIVADGAYVVAEHEGLYIFRQLRITEDGKYLAPLNTHYPTQQLESDKAIVGVVIKRAGRRRKEGKSYL